MTQELPIAIIGAGPVGLAAAVHALDRGLTPMVLERSPQVAASLRDWGHVRVFSPWRYNVDDKARTFLEDRGWTAPDPEALPTGAELVADYLQPLAAHPALAPHIRCGAEVTAVSRQGLGKLGSVGRTEAPFVLHWRDAEGRDRRTAARAVIDAAGTWGQPAPMGVDGLPVPGERACADRIAYGIPDVLGRDRATYAGRRVLVVGGGDSAINGVLDLLKLQQEAPATRVLWALRRGSIARIVGGGRDDQLPARGALGLAAKAAIESGRLELLAPFAATGIARGDDGVQVAGHHGGASAEVAVDRIIVCTGLRPDLEMLRELRVEVDPIVEAPPKLAPLIDPNLHSCGTVPPHGAAELAHPEEPGFYIVGSKAYGRAPTFLMMTGYEQVRSVMAELAGDHAAAKDVRVELPETGVCRSDRGTATEPASCCGAAATAPACC